SHEDRRLIEKQARYARAAVVADSFTEALMWMHRRYKQLVDGVKTSFRMRAAEAQLLSMSDRELADIGLSRTDIPFAVRDGASGVSPQIDVVAGEVTAANQNLRRAA